MIESMEELVWRKAKRCSAGACIEVATDGEKYFVRDSKNPQSSPLAFTRTEWAGFVAGVREGDFDF